MNNLVEYRSGFYFPRRVKVTNPAILAASEKALKEAKLAAKILKEKSEKSL